MVSALVCESNACFGQITVDDKSNEITRLASAGPMSDAVALMLLKKEKSCKLGVKSKRKKAGWNRDHLLTVLGIV